VFYLVRHDGGIGGDVSASDKKGEMMFDDNFKRYVPQEKMLEVARWFYEYARIANTAIFVITFDWPEYRGYLLTGYRINISFKPVEGLPDNMSIPQSGSNLAVHLSQPQIDGIHVLKDPSDASKIFDINPVAFTVLLARADEMRNQRIAELEAQT
jgi:hypothetical protein